MKPFTPPPTSHIDLDATREEKGDFERIEAALHEAFIKLDAPTAAVIGPLSIETRTQQDHHDRWHQIRSKPLPDFGGAEFRYDVPRGRVLPKNPIMEGIAQGAPAFVEARGAIVARVEAARAMATAALQRLSGAWCDPALVAVGISVIPDWRSMTTVLEVRTLGHGLFPITERLQAETIEALAAKLDALLERHARRARLRTMLLADGAVGWVEETTRRILATVGKDLRWAMELLEERGTVKLWFPLDPGSIHARVWWREGVLRVDFGNAGIGTNLEGDELTIFKLVSAKILAARVGRPLARLTKDQFIPAESIVFDARRTHVWTILTLAIPKTLIPAARARSRAGGRKPGLTDRR